MSKLQAKTKMNIKQSPYDLRRTRQAALTAAPSLLTRATQAHPRQRVRVAVNRYDVTPGSRITLGHLKIMAVCFLVLIGLVYFVGHHGNVHANTVTPKVAKVSAARIQQLDTSINGLIHGLPQDTVTVLATDMSTGQSVSYGSNASYEAASTAKILSAVYYLHQVEAGKESLSGYFDGYTAQALLKNMIVNSDDASWQAINQELTHTALAKYASSIGFTQFNVTDNTMPASNIQTIMTKLYSGTLLNKSDTSLLLGYMQQANYRDYIVAATPSDDSVYHKAGVVDDDIHDAAVITKNGHAVVITIFTTGNGTYDSVARAEFISNVTKQLTATFLP